MTALLARLHAISAQAWVRLVQAMNALALSAGAIVLSVNAMYPTAISDAAGALPPVAKLAVLAAWAALVHYACHRAAKSA